MTDKDDVLVAVDVMAVLGDLGASVRKVKGAAQGGQWCPLTSHRSSTRGFVVELGGQRKGVWCCHKCGRGGDLFDLVMSATGDGFRAALERVASIAGVSMGGKFRAKGEGHSLPTAISNPLAPEVVPLWRVTAAWAAATMPSHDDALSEWLEHGRAAKHGQSFDPGVVSMLDLCRVATEGSGWLHPAPEYRLLFPYYAPGSDVVRMVRQRLIGEGRIKCRTPEGASCRGLIMANHRARAMMDGGKASSLIIREGEMDYLQTSVDAAPYVAVIGIIAGAWSQAAAALVPDGLAVTVATDDDATGDRYAAEIIETIKHCEPTRARWN